MPRSAPIVGGLLITLAVLALAAPLVMGFGIEHTYGELIRNAQDQSQGRYTVSGEFDRGWLRSTARTVVRLGPETLADARVLEVTHAFSHGPIPLGEIGAGRSPLHLGFVVADTRYDVDAAELPRIAQALAGEPLLLIRFWLGFDGHTYALIESPPIALDDTSFRSDGLRGHVSIEPGDATAKGHIGQGTFRVEDPSGALELGGVVLEFSYAPIEPGGGRRDRGRLEGRVEFGALETNGDVNRLEIDPSFVEFESRIDGTTLGAGAFTLSLGASRSWPVASEAAEPAFALTGLMVSEHTEQGDGDPLSSFSVRSSFEKLITPRGEFGPGALDVAIRNIDATAWSALQDAASEIEASGLEEEARDQARLVLMRDHLPKVLGPSPEVVVERFEFGAPTGTLKGRGRLGVDASDPMMLGNPLMLMASIQADAHLQAPVAMLERLLDLYLAGTVREEAGPLTESDIMEMAAFMRTGMLGRMVEQGNLVTDGETYRFDAKYEDGLPYINGVPADPSFLQGIVPGF